MKRLNKKTKLKIITLIKNGESLNKIKFKTGIPKTTIYYYMRKVIGRKIPQVNINTTNEERIGEIMGLFAGDGGFYYNKKTYENRIRFFFNKKEEVLIDYYRKSLGLLTNKFPRLYEAQSIKILELRSKIFINFILSYLLWESRKVSTIQLKNKNLLRNRIFVVGFLRGLIDSDGYVRKGRKEIYYGSVSKKLFNDFLKGLDLFNLKYKVYLQKQENCLDFHKVRLSGFEVDKFISLVKPLKSYNAPARI